MYGLLSDLKEGSIRLDAFALSTLIHGLPKIDVPLEDAFRLLGLARSVPIDLSRLLAPSDEPAPNVISALPMKSLLRVDQQQRMVNLAIVVCDFELLEKARKAHVQVPWEPLASTLLAEDAPMVDEPPTPSMNSDIRTEVDLMQLKLDFSHLVLLHRLAIWNKDRNAAMHAYQSLLALRASISRLVETGFPLNPSTLRVFSQLQQSALVRALSYALEYQDIGQAIRIVHLTMQSLGGRSIGHEALRRLLTAVSSPHFHHHPGMNDRNDSYINPSALLQVLTIIRKWSIQQSGGAGAPKDPRHDRLHEAHRVQYIRQIFASPSILDRLIKASILAFLSLPHDSHTSPRFVIEQAIEGFQTVILTMAELHALDSKRWFLDRMQLHGEALDQWLHPEDLAKGAGWKQNQATLEKVISTNWQNSREAKPRL
jgi:hypothetical protein